MYKSSSNIDEKDVGIPILQEELLIGMYNTTWAS